MALTRDEIDLLVARPVPQRDHRHPPAATEPVASSSGLPRLRSYGDVNH